MTELDEGDRQLVLLALGRLAAERPGWDHALNRLALRFDQRLAGPVRCKHCGRPPAVHEVTTVTNHQSRAVRYHFYCESDVQSEEYEMAELVDRAQLYDEFRRAAEAEFLTGENNRRLAAAFMEGLYAGLQVDDSELNRARVRGAQELASHLELGGQSYEPPGGGVTVILEPRTGGR